MKVSSKHLVILIMLLTASFIALALLRQPGTPVNGATATPIQDPETHFLEEARELQKHAAATEAADAALPPAGDEKTGTASIALETLDLDMGLVPVTEMTRRQLMVYNKGAAPLVLSDIKTTCPCTKGVIPETSRTIPPGGQAPIDIIINPFLIRGFDAVKSLSIYSNDPKNPYLNFVVRSRVVPEFTVEPENVNLGTVRKGKAAEQTILVRQNINQEFEVTEVTLKHPTQKETPLDDLDVSLREKPEPEWQAPGMREYEITLKTKDNMPLGALLRYVYIMTNLRRMPYYPLKIEAVVESFYTLDPSIPNAVTLARAPGSLDTVTNMATIRSEYDIAISDLKYDEQFLEASVSKDEKKKATYIMITLKAVPAGELVKDINFTVNGPTASVPETVRVNIFGNGMKRGRGL